MDITYQKIVAFSFIAITLLLLMFFSFVLYRTVKRRVDESKLTIPDEDLRDEVDEDEILPEDEDIDFENEEVRSAFALEGLSSNLSDRDASIVMGEIDEVYKTQREERENRMSKGKGKRRKEAPRRKSILNRKSSRS